MAADAGRAVGHVAKTGGLRRGHRPLRRPHSVHAAVDGLQPGIPFGTFQVTPFRVYAIHELPRGSSGGSYSLNDAANGWLHAGMDSPSTGAVGADIADSLPTKRP
jgi:hypothetical protein